MSGNDTRSGRPAPDAVAPDLDARRESLDADEATLAARRKALADAETALDAEVSEYV
ncbi:hypothetical protein [Halorubrum sp. SD626R]|uniref:hypothetical protein n=1 Tax=Halorubrum sp. SD626R TaxID=1419722 RepID=UPI00130535C0|nr:hypothetical protein [Halorubrum sp. SD626R]